MKTLATAMLVILSGVNSDAKQTGIASWYGKENSRSCTGKVLRHRIPAAAHKTLPIGSWVKITSVKTNKYVVAVIEDRGPYTKGRIVDLNKPAADRLGITKSGIDRVTIERIY